MAVTPCTAISHPPSLVGRLPALTHEAMRLWNASSSSPPHLGPRYTWWRQAQNARATARVIDELASRLETYPSDDTAREAWRMETRARLQRVGEMHLGWPDGYRRLLFGDAFFDAAIGFAKQARTFDPALALDDLWQALRNVWIGNSLQMLLGRPVTLTPGLFAYSMLYPVTDNLLDAPGVSSTAKRGFAERLGRRLHGDRLLATQQHDAHAFELIQRIEGEFPRAVWADVWASLLTIHEGQLASLKQQQPPQLSEHDLLDLSIAKGGASVLADLYLVAGEATAAEERLAFCYGVFLQLLDDLQDVNTDSRAGHQTIFTRAARLGPLDQPTATLVYFIDAVLDLAPVTNAPAHADCLDLIRRNCRTLIVGVVAERAELFTPGFRRALERQWPLGLSAMRRLRRRARRRFETTSKRLRARHGVTPLEMLMESPS